MSKPNPNSAMNPLDGADKLFVNLFGGISLLMFTIAGVSGALGYRQLASEQSAPGKVVDMVLRQQISTVDRAESTSGERSVFGPSDRKIRVAQEFYYPIVEFKLPNGTIKTVQLDTGSWPPSHEKGEAVTVRYAAEKPMKARIQSTGGDMTFFILPMITGTIGLVFMMVPVGILYFARIAKSTPS
jgi:hypothetical protein